ncbi:MAG: signal peptidase I, partial [Bacillota bacterium]
MHYKGRVMEMENSDSTKSQDKRWLNIKEAVSWILYLGAAFIIAILITRYVIVNAYIPTESMATTIMPKDRVIASRLHYIVSNPERGDIVVFKYPDNEDILYVKRVIGLPGETVELKDGQVYI